MNLHTILVPVDFTPCSIEAIEEAVSLSRDLHSIIILLHVLDFNAQVISMGPPHPEREKELKIEAEGELKALASQLARCGITVETALVEGQTHKAIVEYAKLRNAGVIVLGKHPGKFWHLFQQHTVESVQRSAPCLVKVVSEETRNPRELTE